MAPEDDDPGMRVSLRDVYDSVQSLSSKVDKRFDSIEIWQRNHEITDAVEFAQIRAELTAQKDAVAMALTTTKEAMSKAEIAVDKRFDKVDAIGRNQDRLDAGIEGHTSGVNTTQTLVFAIVGVLLGAAVLLSRFV